MCLRIFPEVRDARPDVADPIILLGPFDILVEVFSIGPHIHEEDGGLHLGGMFFRDHRFLRGIHAADRRTVALPNVRIPRSDALNPCHLTGVPAVRGSQNLTFEGTGGREESLELNARNDIRESAVTVLRL